MNKKCVNKELKLTRCCSGALTYRIANITTNFLSIACKKYYLITIKLSTQKYHYFTICLTFNCFVQLIIFTLKSLGLIIIAFFTRNLFKKEILFNTWMLATVIQFVQQSIKFINGEKFIKIQISEHKNNMNTYQLQIVVSVK